MTNINSLNQSGDGQGSRYAPDVENPDIDLGFILSQLRRNRILLLGLILLGLLIGSISYLAAEREYTAHTTLMINIDGDAASQQGAGLLGAFSVGQPDPIATPFAIAESNALLAQVVDEMQLVLDPEFNAKLREVTLRDRIIEAVKPIITSVKDAVKNLVKGDAALSDSEARDPDWLKPEVLERRQTIIALRRSVAITDMQDDMRLRIAVTTGDRVKSSRIAGTMANKLNALLKQSKVSALGSARKWIEREASRVEVSLRDIERQINAEMSRGSVSPDSEVLGENAERLVEGELILEANKRREQGLIQLAAAISRIEDGATPRSAFATMPDDLRTDLFTDYEAIFGWEQRDEVPSRSDLAAATRLIERDLASQTEVTSRREQEILPLRAYTRKLSTAQNRYIQLQTRYTASTELLTTLRERLAELQIELAGEVERMTVLERPYPPLSHSSPSLPFTLAWYILLGLAAAVAVILMRFFKRDAFLSLEDVEQTFEAPAIAIVSDFRRNLRDGFSWDRLPNEIQEAYRRAYTAVFVVSEGQGSRSLMVTSSIPGEGKTTSSLYIAAAAAEEGKKTLVIDLDFRKRSVSRYLKLKGKLGVFSVFRGDDTLENAVIAYRYGKNDNGFDVLTTDGRRSSEGENSRETLSAGEVRDLIASAKEQYEVVIVDVPPILAVQDAGMVGRMVDAVFCVVSTRDLQRKAARRAAKEWERARVKLFGLLVRGEKSELHEYYDYSYYHYDYAAGAEDDRPRRPSQRKPKPRKDVGRHQASGSSRD